MTSESTLFEAGEVAAPLSALTLRNTCSKPMPGAAARLLLLTTPAR
jgi:hypothetical protein